MLFVVSYRGTWIETHNLSKALYIINVVSYRGTWIETPTAQMARLRTAVVSYRGTWIETLINSPTVIAQMSYLIEVRGLKLLIVVKYIYYTLVVSYRGTWIET